MTGYLEDLERRRHHRQPRSSHWNADRTDMRPHPGPVSASCPLCRREVAAVREFLRALAIALIERGDDA